MRPVLLLLAPALLLGAVDGVVRNETTGKVQANATVTLIRLGQGMETVASAKSDASGKFSMAQDLTPGAPHLVQVLFEGVTYNKMLPPGSAGTGLALPVYNSADRVADAEVSRHLLAIQPSGGEVSVNEILVYTNTGTTTLNPAAGAIRVYVPPQVKGPLQVSVQGPQGMPLQRVAEKTAEANVYAVKFPIRPGETRVDFNYAYAAASPVVFKSRALHAGAIQVLVPEGVSLEGSGARRLGQDPRVPGTIYQIDAREYSLTIQGTGSFREPEQQTSQAPAAPDESSPGIEQSKPRIYKRLPAVLGLTFTMLALGFAMMYRNSRA